MSDVNVENVVSQLRAREERGLSKYGVNTERTDLSTLEWLQHLQEELMDFSSEFAYDEEIDILIPKEN